MSTPSHRPGLKFVIGPEGKPMSIADLPCVKTVRWVPSRKALVVAAVRGGLLTAAEACERYSLSPEELDSWMGHVEAHGYDALRTTRIQQYRN